MDIVKPDGLRFLKALIFGPPGQGKTTLLGSAQEDARLRPMLLLDFEGGMGSLAGLDIDVAPIRSWDDFDEVYENLAEGNEVDGVDYSKYKSVGIDSITEVHIFALLDILRKEGANRKDPELLEQRDYGKASVQMRRLLRAFRDLPIHVVFTALAKEVEKPRRGKVQVPMLSGQMAEEAPGLMDVVGYLAVTEDEDGDTMRTLLLKSYPKFEIKARTPYGGEIPDELDDPTLGGLLDLLGYPPAEGKKKTKKTKE